MRVNKLKEMSYADLKAVADDLSYMIQSGTMTDDIVSDLYRIGKFIAFEMSFRVNEISEAVKQYESDHRR